MAIAVMLGLVLIATGMKAAGKGLVLGTVFSIINFVVMAAAIPMRIGNSRQKTFVLSIASIFFRYVFLAVPVVVAIRYDQFDLTAVVFGIFMVQIAILSDHLLRLMPSRRGKRV